MAVVAFRIAGSSRSLLQRCRWPTQRIRIDAPEVDVRGANNYTTDIYLKADGDDELGRSLNHAHRGHFRRSG